MTSPNSKHKVFSHLIKYAEFYKELSYSAMRFVQIGSGVINFDTYVFTSMQGTLESISTILSNRRVNDAYALLRKYNDAIVINIYANLYLEEEISLENLIVEKINKWIKGKESLPRFWQMLTFIQSSGKLTKLNDLLFRDETYDNIRKRCNDHMHYNFFKFLFLNDNEVYINNIGSVLDSFSKDLLDLFIMHISYIFCINEQYMMASDYTDSLDIGLTPEEGSQYYVAPFVQDIFDSVIKENRMDLANEIKRKTIMLLE